MGEILQAHVSAALVFFWKDFLEKYQLQAYSCPTSPALFFGCYFPEDISIIERHRSTRVIIWGGHDAMNPLALHALQRLPDCWHIAISDFIARDLSRWGLPFVRLPICPVDHAGLGFEPCKKGDAVYIYSGRNEQRFYGCRLYHAMQRRFPDTEFVVCYSDSYPREKLAEVYEKCFMGMRMVPHDGLPNSVIELGLMGIPTIYNGGLPGSLPYRRASDIARHIMEQRRNIGTVDLSLPEAIKKFLALPPDWKTVEYYRRNAVRYPVSRLSAFRNSVQRQRSWMAGAARSLVRAARSRLGGKRQARSEA